MESPPEKSFISLDCVDESSINHRDFIEESKQEEEKQTSQVFYEENKEDGENEHSLPCYHEPLVDPNPVMKHYWPIDDTLESINIFNDDELQEEMINPSKFNAFLTFNIFKASFLSVKKRSY